MLGYTFGTAYFFFLIINKKGLCSCKFKAIELTTDKTQLPLVTVAVTSAVQLQHEDS